MKKYNIRSSILSLISFKGKKIIFTLKMDFDFEQNGQFFIWFY